jgi:hypothetical protein
LIGDGMRDFAVSQPSCMLRFQRPSREKNVNLTVRTVNWRTDQT